MRIPVRRLAGVTAATAAAATLTVGTQTAAHASGACNGNVIQTMNDYGYSSRLIRSYDGGSICVNTWNQTGHQAYTVAYMATQDDVPGVWSTAHMDDGNYYSYASTGFYPIPWGHCISWGGPTYLPGWNTTSHCF